MDKKTLLAIALTALVIVVTPMIFKTPAPPPRPVDSAQPAPTANSPTSTGSTTTSAATVDAQSPQGTTAVQPTAPAPSRSQQAEFMTVHTSRADYTLTNLGGVPTGVALPEYRSLRPGPAKGNPVQLVEEYDRLFRLSLRTGTGVVALDTVAFKFGAPRQENGATVVTLTSTSLRQPVTLTYRFPADSFVMSVEGTVGAEGPAQVTAWLPTRLRSDEADVRDDTRHLGVAYRLGNADAKGIAFGSIDTVPQLDSGTVRWFAVRNKYFVVAAVADSGAAPFQSLIRRGEPHEGDATAAHVSATMPVTNGRFAFRVFAGPQSWVHLRATAAELENVNPYGGWLHGVVQPFATIVMRMLLWMKATTNLGYGWVLVIFGVAVRLLMWPLNQNAMRSSMKLQRIQPQLQETQAKYKNDPEKQREAMMKLYAEHGMSPFTPILGCLPMLLPMPILFALYFVFQNTIELRGVSFLWLPDLSLRDPYFITPLFMGVSMFLLSWIGMRGMPPNPQSKMMSYIMPVMFTVLFWNFASGLNLYYAVQNVAALPQQWLLARERVSNKKDVAKKPGGAKGAPGG